MGKELLALAKPDLRVINVARGGIVDEEALAWAVREGVIAGAALDVFASEPTTESPLFELDSVVVTPHLGASTREAQDKAGDTIAEMVLLALAGEFVPFAVNVNAAEASETVRPFLALAERLGRLFTSLAEGVPSTVEVCYEGQIADYDTRILTLATLKGLFGGVSEDPVTYVNAPTLAREHGVEIREVNCNTPVDHMNLITIRGGDHDIAGTLGGRRGEPRIVTLDGHATDVPPATHMLVVRNDDRPGMIGVVGTVLGEADVNIADMDVGRTPTPGSALMVLATTTPVPWSLIDQLRAHARHHLRAPSHRGLALDRDGAGRAELSGLRHLGPQLLARLFLQHVEVAVAAHLEDLRAHLHAGPGAGAHVEVHDNLHSMTSRRAPLSAGRDGSRPLRRPADRDSSARERCARRTRRLPRGRCRSGWP